MSSRSLSTLLSLLLLAASAGCRDADRPVGPQPAGRVVVSSDPEGARILVNGEGTGKVTPDTLDGLEGDRDTVAARLDTVGLTYGYAARVGSAPADSVVTIHGPLLLQCTGDQCETGLVTYHSRGGTRFAASPLGTLFTVRGQSGGLYWPGSTGNSYVAGGAAVIAGVVAETGDTVALGPYDPAYLAGRPAPELTDDPDRFRLSHRSWILPPRGVRGIPTIRALRLSQEVIAADVDDVIVLRLVFRNISDRASYRALDTSLPPDGFTYEAGYIGFALDADIGNADGETEDDLVSFVPDERLAFIYDSDFRGGGFDAGWVERPALIGLRVLDAPPGTDVVLTGWPRETADGTAVDWAAGSRSERFGWRWLSGNQVSFEGHPDARVGYAPSEPTDYRIAVSAGPVRLAPGDSAVITIALGLAPPAAGSYTSGTVIGPGDPRDEGRALRTVAQPLVERLRAAESVILP